MLYSFEDFTLDAARRELRRSGALIALQPQVFDLLEYSIRNRERVVSKDDLLAAVWKGRIVSESTLSTRINAARSAIGDSGEEQRLIRTAHGKGIRFVGAVREVNNPAEICRSSDLSQGATGRASRQPAPLSAERRQLTVMSCNLAEATALAARLDPEDLRDLMAAYRRAVVEIVARFEGFVARRSGRRIISLFRLSSRSRRRCRAGDPQCVSGRRYSDPTRTRRRSSGRASGLPPASWLSAIRSTATIRGRSAGRECRGRGAEPGRPSPRARRTWFYVDRRKHAAAGRRAVRI